MSVPSYTHKQVRIGSCLFLAICLFFCFRDGKGHLVTVPTHRNGFGQFLEALELRRGAEIGVQTGRFSSHILTDWASCEYFVLVDPWKEQNETYTDFANIGDTGQELNYQETINRLSFFSGILDIKRMTSKEASFLVKDNSLDFVYLDAQHSYCSAKEDLELWWPKLRMGGIMAGHDFINQDELDHITLFAGGQPVLHLNGRSTTMDWTLCPDGVTRNRGLVKGAVLEFASAQKNIIVAETTETHHAKSFLMQKPFI